MIDTNTLLEKKVLKSKICCSCLKRKELETGFHKNSAMKDGRYNRCKICVNLGLNCRPKPSNKKIKRFKKNDGPYLLNIRDTDWIEMYDFLKQIGYDLNGSIHEQFCSKYNLTPKERTKEKSIQFTAQELGLC